MTGFVVLAIGVAALAYSATVLRGWLFEDSNFVRAARARYAYGLVPSPWFSQRRVIAFSPFLSAGLIAGGGSQVGRELGADLAAAILGGLTLLFVVLTVFAMTRPGPFEPAWHRDMEARQRAGLPPSMPPPPEGARMRVPSTWQVAAVVVVFGALLIVGFAVDWPAVIQGGLLLGAAFTIAAYIQARSQAR